MGQDKETAAFAWDLYVIEVEAAGMTIMVDLALAETEADAYRAWDDAVLVLEGLKLRLEPTKTQVTSFDQGFEYLGVTFYRDTYSYHWQDKRIEVQGPFDDWLFSQTGPQGYRG